MVARDRDEAEALERLLAYRRELGLEVERLRPSQARRARARAGADRAARARRAGRPLGRPAAAGGGARRRVRARRRHAAPRPRRRRRDRRRARERSAAGTTARSCAPPASCSRRARGALELPEHARVPVRPVKGQVLRLRDPRGPGLVDRTIRGPRRLPRPARRRPLRARRDDGGARVGHGADRGRACYELLRDMSEVVPGVLELEIEELSAGLRPAHARQPARDRPGRARWARVGGRALPQRHPAGRRSPPTSSPVRCAARRCPSGLCPADPRRFAGVPA